MAALPLRQNLDKMKTKVLTAAVIFLLTTTSAFANGDKDKTKKNNKASDNTEMVSLTGTVVDKDTGEALAGVLVKLEETEASVYTDFEGNFELLVTPGSYKISTTMISYKTASNSFEAKSSGDQLKISLENLAAKNR